MRSVVSLVHNLDAVCDAEEAVGGLAGAVKLFTRMAERLSGKEMMDMTHHDLEDAMWEDGKELLRQLMQAHLDAREGGQVAGGEVTGADGVARSTVRHLPRNLETRFGTVVVHRAGYAAPGVDSLVPMDAALNLPAEKYSFSVQRMVADEAAKGSFDNVVEVISKSTGAHVPKRQAEELAVSSAADFADFYRLRHRQALEHVDTGPILVLTSDGVGIRVLERERRDSKLRGTKVKKSGLLERLSPGEKPGLARMATVAAVYTVQPHIRDASDVLGEGEAASKVKRPKPEHKRVWASIVEDTAQVVASAFDEACYRDPKRRKTWVALVDGNNHQLNVLKAMARRHKVELTMIVDIYHVSEYVWAAAHVFHPDDASARRDWVQERLKAILEGSCSHVAAGMRRSATLQGIAKGKRMAVDACARYLLNKKEYLKYDQYLAKGLPIGTGVIEGAGRHLINDRMDIAGARWGLETAEAVLQLRALRCSGDMDEYWSYHTREELERNHARNYERGQPPKPEHPTTNKPRLRLVTT